MILIVTEGLFDRNLLQALEIFSPNEAYFVDGDGNHGAQSIADYLLPIEDKQRLAEYSVLQELKQFALRHNQVKVAA